jgi:hypothetical protein
MHQAARLPKRCPAPAFAHSASAPVITLSAIPLCEARKLRSRLKTISVLYSNPTNGRDCVRSHLRGITSVPNAVASGHNSDLSGIPAYTATNPTLPRSVLTSLPQRSCFDTLSAVGGICNFSIRASARPSAGHGRKPFARRPTLAPDTLSDYLVSEAALAKIFRANTRTVQSRCPLTSGTRSYPVAHGC